MWWWIATLLVAKHETLKLLPRLVLTVVFIASGGEAAT